MVLHVLLNNPHDVDWRQYAVNVLNIPTYYLIFNYIYMYQ